MDFSTSDEMKAILRTLRRFIDSELQPLEQQIDDAGYASPDMIAPLKAKAVELGLFAMHMPPEAGGPGLSTVEMCLADEEIGRTTPVLARRVFGHVHRSLLAATGAQRERYLEPAVLGQRIGCIALTEPGAGSDATRLQTTASRDGDYFVLNGRKHFITDGDIADFAIVVAVTDRSKGPKGGITAFLVDRETPGFDIGRKQEMMGQRGLGHCELVFEDCRVPLDHVLGQVGQGFPIIMSGISSVRLGLIGARSVGTAGRILEMCVQHANDRVQFGQPIGHFQMVQKMLSDSLTEIFATRMMVLNTAWEIDQGHDPRDKVSMVKLHASEMLGSVADRAVQIFGGMGVAREMPIERFYRDCRVARIYDGTSEIHRERIAKSLLKRGVGQTNVLTQF